MDKEINTAADFLKWARKFGVLAAAKGFDSTLCPKIKLPKEYQDLEGIPESTADEKILKKAKK